MKLELALPPFPSLDRPILVLVLIETTIRMVPLMKGGSIINFGIHLVAGVFQLPPDIVASQIPMKAPFPTSPAEIAHRKAVDDILCDSSEIWSSNLGYMLDAAKDSKFVNDKMKSLEVSALEDDLEKKQKSYRPSTYGEITTLGARQLFYHMGMTGDFKSNKNDSNTEPETTAAETAHDKIEFCDMGSGVGKFVLQAYMELPRLSRSLGIELAPLRHQHAADAWVELKTTAETIRSDLGGGKDDPSASMVQDATVQHTQGDFLEADISEVTHMYVSSLCFTDKMMHELAVKLEHRAPKLECVATLRAFPMKFMKRGILDRTSYQVVDKMFGMIPRKEYVEMSWTDRIGTGCLVYLYTKVPPI